MLSVTFSSLFSLSPITEGQSSGSREVTGRALRRLVLSLLPPQSALASFPAPIFPEG